MTEELSLVDGLEELSKFTVTQKYSGYMPEHQRREQWDEIVDRSLQMHLRKFHELPEKDKEEIVEAFNLVKEKKVLPSMRSMQYGGIAVERNNIRNYNCAFLHIHNTRCIEKAFYLLLCGAGCGFGLRREWVDRFPEVTHYKVDDINYTIDDSIEGWAESIGVLINSFLVGNKWSNLNVRFDYSKIRPKGAPISHGGKAPGSKGLWFAHEKIRMLLRYFEGNKLRPIDVYDILMHVADAVLSGGLRRAACIALFDKDDALMMSAKIGNWFVDNPQRARSNNTVLLKRDELTREELAEIIEHTRQWGEPGFALVDDLNVGINPCGEISFLPFHDGETGIQLCNLTTINGNKVRTKEDFFDYVKAAALIGTLQASYTELPFLDEIDKKITEEEALLGVSVLGWLANSEVLLNEELKRQAAELATDVNEHWASKLGINPAARVTCVKPDGNSSCVLGSPFSGIHPAHSPLYIRRVQVNKSDPVYEHFMKFNPQACEESIYSATKTDAIISFPISVDNENAIFKSDLSALEHLALIKSVQTNWVNGGERNNKKPISHAVSCTVLVGEEEWDEVINYLYVNRYKFTNVSLLPRSGDKDYAQAPYEACVTEEDYVKWVDLQKGFKTVDYTLMIEEDDTTSRSEELGCAGGACLI